MPLPLILGLGAAVAGTVGVTNGLKGAMDAQQANSKMKYAENQHNENIKAFEEANEATSKKMDELGKLELEILNRFSDFADLIEMIQNRPQFKEYDKDGVKLPHYDGEELNKVSVGASVILGGLSGAALGTAGGFAAAGATTSAVMAFGTASTGTAIATLKGAALTKATLAALGGGALHSGVFAGGMALGSAVLGAATLGVGLLVGGSIFGATGAKLSEEADEAYRQMKKAEKVIDKSIKYLEQLELISYKYYLSLKRVYISYIDYFDAVFLVVKKKKDWNKFSDDEKLALQNLVLIVGLLYKMCQVNLVIQTDKKSEINKINEEEVGSAMNDAEKIMRDKPHTDKLGICDKKGVEHFDKGIKLYEEENFKDSCMELEKSAKLGNKDAMSLLGAMYSCGIGVERDEKKACKWFEQSSRHPNAATLYTMGSVFFNGTDMTVDKEKGYEYIEKAALLGHEDAVDEMWSVMHIGEDAYKWDFVKALVWAERHAEMGSVRAMYFTGYLSHEAYGIFKNHAKAKEWLTKAATSGEEYFSDEAKKCLKKWYKLSI